MTPAVNVAATGDCLLLTLARNLNSKPSRAMANRIRGKGNIEPRRLEQKNSKFTRVILRIILDRYAQVKTGHTKMQNQKNSK